MPYNKEDLPRFSNTAGKISILAAVAGFCAFMFAFMVDLGQQELQRVAAQSYTATTTLVVLNTPPTFTENASEVLESSTSTPTNSGSVIQWTAVANDANLADYYLLVCSVNASPTAQSAPATPVCGGGIQWGVSTATPSDTRAFVSTTTVEGGLFSEVNQWYAWVCDGDAVQPECSPTPTTGLSATNSSPFHMNSRPVLTNASSSGAVDPGSALSFFSTSSDPDVAGGNDTVSIIVCSSNTNFSTSTDSCTDYIASSTVFVASDASAATTTASVIRDQTYQAYVYLIDNHGHEALAPIQANFDINNVAPTIVGGDIDLNTGSDLALLVPNGETTGFSLDFTISDANSCINSTGATSTEITGYEVSVFRSGIGTAGCDAAAGDYDANNCYSSGVATSTWDLSCTAATSSCTGITDDTQIFNCSFPLWFIADPTDTNATPTLDSPFAAENWTAAVRGVDDDFATGTQATNTSQTIDLLQLTAIDLQTAEIAYGALAPGDTAPFTLLGGTAGATTSDILNVGNTGLDQEVLGDSMCDGYSPSSPCASNASSTIPESQQKFSSTTIAYASILANTLSSTTYSEVELDVNKTTATSSPNLGTTYWGIVVPASISVAGSYQGLNTFRAVTAETGDW